MPVYNGEKYLREAIESILNQTFSDFEFLIINDGSTDQSVKIVKSYTDPRVLLIHHTTNIGITKSLNIGLDLARGEYIARMDSDDISLPERLEKQVAFMDANPEVGVCGTFVKEIGEREHIWTFPTDDANIRCRMIFDKCSFAHPTVILRNDVLKKYNLRYHEDYTWTEDYEFWVRCSRYTNLANLRDILLYYRLHSDNVGKIHSSRQRETSCKARLLQIKNLGIDPTETEAFLHNDLACRSFKSTPEFLQNAHEWLINIKEANEQKKIYPELVFSKVLAELWYVICSRATGMGLWTWRRFWRSPLSKSAGLSWQSKAKFALKCGLRWQRRGDRC